MVIESYFSVVLVEPEIPNNTGNIGRTCVGVNSRLQLIEPLGFEISDKKLKRAGLDYWPYLHWERFKSLEEWLTTVSDLSRIFFFSTKGKKNLYEASFDRGDYFIFGKETKGLNSFILESFSEQIYTIPMIGPIRSLNLANSVSVVLYEGFRQLWTKGMIQKSFDHQVDSLIERE